VRGIASLYMLKQLMIDVAGDENAKPCEYFDMIAGTSTGGSVLSVSASAFGVLIFISIRLIAIMLGRLRMAVPKCIEAYNVLSKEIFGDGENNELAAPIEGAWYDEKTFEKAVGEFLASSLCEPGFDKNSFLANPDPDACKVYVQNIPDLRLELMTGTRFVLTCEASNINDQLAAHLRTYNNPNVSNSNSDTTIVAAARATSAAPSYFHQKEIHGKMFIDGGLAANNPISL